MALRPYQQDAKNAILQAWADGKQNVCLVMPTGAGKTVTMSDMVHDHDGVSCVIAHRQELVSQISLALAREGVRHRIIAPTNIVKLCVQLHMDELRKSYYDPQGRCAVAGVDTLIRRTEQFAKWIQTVTFWLIDETHHVCTDNKWGTAVALFPKAKGLGVTATPLRADGKGLSRETDGVFDHMVIGQTMRWLINNKYLTEYRIFAPPSDLDLSEVKISASTGDYSAPSLVQATRRSHIMGDVVSHYQRIANGKRGIVFATDVQSATEMAVQFNQAGIPAISLSAKTSDLERIQALRKFKIGEYQIVVNVDLFGEGTDIPAVEVVIMARATQSYGLYVQIFGRALRLMEGKEFALIIDHVGNVVRHGLPDAPRIWSLDRRDKKSKAPDPDAIPVKACPTCAAVYERIYPTCPYCGFKPPIAGRSTPEMVDGDLHELSPDVLAEMRAGIAHLDMPASDYRVELASKHCPLAGQAAGVNRHVANQEAQVLLRDSIAYWAGYQRAQKRPDSESYRRFYLRFGIDVLSAQALKSTDALTLRERVENEMFY